MDIGIEVCIANATMMSILSFCLDANCGCIDMLRVVAFEGSDKVQVVIRWFCRVVVRAYKCSAFPALLEAIGHVVDKGQ